MTKKINYIVKNGADNDVEKNKMVVDEEVFVVEIDDDSAL